VREEEDVAALHRRLAAAVARVCPRWLADHADDITQNAIVQLLASRRSSGGNPGFSSMYLMKAAHGVVVDEIRRRCRRKESTADDPAALERVSSRAESPERASAAREIARGIVDCLTRLADARRLAVTLFLRGCTVPETARRLGWSPKRTEHLVYRALSDLRRCLGSKGMTP
jgi:RNA polymerase sigma factor (sigma-70 family)